MLAGILSMMAFNVIDAFFIGKLGAGPLAAITLTFPVAAIISTCTIGLGVGAMAAIAKSIGSGDHSRIGRLTTDTLSLSVLLVAVLCIAGIVLINPIFTLLGASPELLPEIRRYMYLWYPGLLLYTVPMISSNILRATGDTVTPSAIMIGSMVVNALLDPLFIFGLGPIPALGLAGAATASLITRALALCFALWLLWHREHLIVNPLAHKHELLESWKTVLVIGMPVAISNMIVPAATGVITAIVTRFGTEAVAGFGVGTRIESLGYTLIIAASTGLSPFVGQNFGAGKYDRIRIGVRYAQIFSLIWGAAMFVVLLFAGSLCAQLFNGNPGVVHSARLYLLIVPLSLGLRGIHQIVWTSLNVLGHPYHSMILEGILAIALWIPCSLAGAHFFGLAGVYAGISLSNCIAGALAGIWIYRVLKRK
jgi:putative MATE family efflux protein